MYTELSNEIIKIRVNHYGAELRSIQNVVTKKEYLWDANPDYWNRSSPVLFPFVGGLKNKQYRHEGVTYPMNQHGFARDMIFEKRSQTDNEVWYFLNSTEKNYLVYPFRFRLEIGYRLEQNKVIVMWKVIDTDTKEMYFSIGAHPAFFCNLNGGALRFLKKDGSAPAKLCTRVFGQGGCATAEMKDYDLKNGLLALSSELFDNDALIIEDSQVQRISVLNASMKEYLAVEFDSPLVGVWSPPKRNAPFLCIEPWYGRCDREDFEGELKDREWGNWLEAGREFSAEYSISIY